MGKMGNSEREHEEGIIIQVWMNGMNGAGIIGIRGGYYSI